jgi:ABC-2 type transport system permease protein
MSLESSAMSDLPLDIPAAKPAVAAARRPLYWSVRRELWENRSIYVAPLAVAGVILLGFPFSLIGYAGRFQQTQALPLARQAAVHAELYEFAAAMIMLTSLIVAVFYCLSALQAERRDRSILFWKSLPVSDFTTVLSKAMIPLAVLPAVAFVLVVAVRMLMLVVSTAVLAAHGVDPTPLWSAVAPLSGALALIYASLAMALWYAPIYGWLLLVSAWARRVAFLWAFGPPFVLGLFDWIAFHGFFFGRLLGYRLVGVTEVAFVPHSHSPLGLADLDPLRFLATPGLWLGFLFAAGCFAAAVWLRRRRQPD